LGRARTIDRDAVLDAAERVVSREGAARLTVDAVACEAGISKASVLYDYKSKHELVKAVIARRVSDDETAYRETAARFARSADSAIRGQVAMATRSYPEEERAVAYNLCAALGQDADLRAPVQEAFRRRVDEIRRTSEHPDGALLAFLAVEGLIFIDHFGLHDWTPDERARLIAGIDWLIGQNPETAPPAEGAPDDTETPEGEPD
jgi:AcrR family transcriptional regulator